MNKLRDVFKTHHMNNIGQGGLTSDHAREAIYKDLLELMGENEDMQEAFENGRDSMRAELRKAISDYCGVK